MSQTDSLDARLNFMGLDAAAQMSLRRVKAIVMSELPGALDSFYSQVQAYPETRRFFTSQAHVGSAKDRQINHWETISSGQFDQKYVQAVTTVGETHARIGLEPRWYIGGYALVLEALIRAVLVARWPRSRLGGRGAEVGEVAAELGALAKATLLDMDYAISVYLAAAEEARRRSAAEVLAAERSTVVDSVGEGMTALAAGDLTYRMVQDLPVEYAKLRDDFNAALARLEGTIGAVAVTTGSLGASSDELAHASDDLSRRTEKQAAGLEQTAAALDQITATVKTTAEGARQASSAVAEARRQAEHSGQVVSRAVDAMGQIEASSREIGQIVGVIDEIAFQTNLLALNAGVEAARAGDAGRGFAVVASEVRALAQRSAEAAKEIKVLISASSQQVAEGVELVGETGKALQSIVTKVAEIDTVISAISASAQEQATGLTQVNTAINQMDQVVQQNAAMVEQSGAATHSMKSETSELVRLVGTFRVGPELAGAVERRKTGAGGGESPVSALRRRVALGLGQAAPAPSDWEEF